jgi:hypothetical protein
VFVWVFVPCDNWFFVFVLPVCCVTAVVFVCCVTSGVCLCCVTLVICIYLCLYVCCVSARGFCVLFYSSCFVFL